MFTIPLYDDNPTEHAPIITYVIIGLCVAVFLWQLGLSPREEIRASYALGLVPALLFGNASLPEGVALVPPWATIYTSMFLHGGWMHILGNMWFLWIFGNNIEDALGRPRFVLFYLLCGTAAALAQAFAFPGAEQPMIGASGAIAGVLGAYIVLHPHANVRVLLWFFVFVRLLNVPAWIVLGVWFALQLFSGLSTPLGGEGGGVAFWAHVGGFVAGVALIFVMRRREVKLLQPARTVPFAISPAGSIGDRAGYRGSVPPAGGLPPRARGPWG
jgi:membrane associated rhomboid family serine protease